MPSIAGAFRKVKKILTGAPRSTGLPRATFTETAAAPPSTASTTAMPKARQGVMNAYMHNNTRCQGGIPPPLPARGPMRGQYSSSTPLQIDVPQGTPTITRSMSKAWGLVDKKNPTDLPANAIMWQGRRLDVVNDDGAASAHGAKCEVQNADGRKEFVPTGLLDIVNDVDEHVEEQVGAELGHDDGDEKPDFLLQLEKQEQVTIDTEYGSNHRKQMLDRSRRSYAFVNTAVGKSFEFTLVYNATSSCRDGMTHM
eukprot:gene23681-25221_t